LQGFRLAAGTTAAGREAHDRECGNPASSQRYRQLRHGIVTHAPT
jgi:hypothetical protein